MRATFALFPATMALLDREIVRGGVQLNGSSPEDYVAHRISRILTERGVEQTVEQVALVIQNLLRHDRSAVEHLRTIALENEISPEARRNLYVVDLYLDLLQQGESTDLVVEAIRRRDPDLSRRQILEALPAFLAKVRESQPESMEIPRIGGWQGTRYNAVVQLFDQGLSPEEIRINLENRGLKISGDEVRQHLIRALNHLSISARETSDARGFANVADEKAETVALRQGDVRSERDRTRERRETGLRLREIAESLRASIRRAARL